MAVIAGVACVFALVANNNAQVAQRDTKNALDALELQKAKVDVSLKKAELAEENTKKALTESQIVVSDMRTYLSIAASKAR